MVQWAIVIDPAKPFQKFDKADQDAYDFFVFDFRSEENRCRVREKELREKDILIQDNLIRFSSFLLQQDTKKKRDEEAAGNERDRILEKEREIDEAE